MLLSKPLNQHDVSLYLLGAPLTFVQQKRPRTHRVASKRAHNLIASHNPPHSSAKSVKSFTPPIGHWHCTPVDARHQSSVGRTFALNTQVSDAAVIFK